MKLNSMIYLITLITTNVLSHAHANRQPEMTSTTSALIVSTPITDEKRSNGLSAGATVTTVGSGVSCQFSSIQDAINADYNEVRIVEGSYAENININDLDIKLLGGYANCTDAINGIYDSESFDSIIAPLSGSNKPGIVIEGNNQSNNVELRNLTIRNGEGSALNFGGGLTVYLADVFIHMNKVIITQNSGDIGGGVLVLNGHADINMNDVQIFSNHANTHGGGIYCSGSENRIDFNSQVVPSAANIFQNSTAGNGGGVYVSDGCHFLDFAGGSGFSGIVLNTADGDGGGIYAQNAARVQLSGDRYCLTVAPYSCFGNNSTGVNVWLNTAQGSGGGIYATGNETSVVASNVLVLNNSGFYGGGAYITDGAQLTTRTPSNSTLTTSSFKCWDNGRCNQFKGNKATANIGMPQTNRGGAFRVYNGAKLDISGTHIEENRADFGSAISVESNNSELKLEGSYIVANGGVDDDYQNRSPISIRYGGEARIDYTTIADNFVPGEDGSSVSIVGADLQIYSSIIHDVSGADALYVTNDSTSSEDCLIVNAFGDISGGVQSTHIVADPEFVDRANGDYHINAVLSPAVDYCDDFFAQNDSQDSDQENRGWDDYTVLNLHGVFDVGADETYGNDVIFKNGFD